LWLIAPARELPDTSALDGWYYAHRGLHDGNETVFENSLTAFYKAVEAGYGIELDVQLTKDKQMVVFHDADLARVCGGDARISEISYEELCAHPLPDGTPIPLFVQVLEAVAGKVPLIVEVKYYGSPTLNAEEALAILREYQGPFCVESFHPVVLQSFKRKAPDIIRGQLASGKPWDPLEVKHIQYTIMKALLLNMLGRPHFISYSYPEDRALGMWLMKRFYKPPLAAWTIRDAGTLSAALMEYDWPIFDHFHPDC